MTSIESVQVSKVQKVNFSIFHSGSGIKKFIFQEFDTGLENTDSILLRGPPWPDLGKYWRSYPKA
jgi:hypothetical protein